MQNTQKEVFLSASDFQLGGIGFKAGMYQVEQLDAGQTQVVIFTMVKPIDPHQAEQDWLVEEIEALDDPAPAIDHALGRAVC